MFQDTNTDEKSPDLILIRTRPRQEQYPFPTPLPLPPCPTRRSRELHIRRLENDMIRQGAADPFLAAFIKCTGSDYSESSDADSDRSSRKSRERGSCNSPSSPRNVLWQQVKAYFSSRARKEWRRKSRRSRVGSIG